MIFVNSRYASSDVTYVLDPKFAETRPTVMRAYRMEATASLYVWKSGDRMDILANNQYGSPALWWRIMDANPGIIDANSIRPGTILRIPS